MNGNVATFHQTRNLTFAEYSQELIIKQKDLEMTKREVAVPNKVDEFQSFSCLYSVPLYLISTTNSNTSVLSCF